MQGLFEFPKALGRVQTDEGLVVEPEQQDRQQEHQSQDNHQDESVPTILAST
jgi:hypothetical protein